MTTINNGVYYIPETTQTDTTIEQIQTQAALDRTGIEYGNTPITAQADFNNALATFNSEEAKWTKKIAEEKDPARKAKLQNFMTAWQDQLQRKSQKLKNLVEEQTEISNMVSRMNQEITATLGNFNNQTIAGMAQLLSIPQSNSEFSFYATA